MTARSPSTGGPPATRADSIIGPMPEFLKRVPGNTAPVRTAPVRKRRCKAWRTTPAMKKQAKRDAEKRERIAARPIVRRAVEAGADTLGKIRKATELETACVRAALRFYIRLRAIERNGKRYHMNGRRR